MRGECGGRVRGQGRMRGRGECGDGECGDRREWHHFFSRQKPRQKPDKNRQKPGTDGTVPISRSYAAKTIPSCRESPAGFFGRPTFRAISARKVECSRAATNSADPSGRPV